MTTQKQALKLIRVAGANVRVRDREYRVNIPNGTEATAYYTEDPDDAIGTAKVMMKQYHQFNKKKKFGMFGA